MRLKHLTMSSMIALGVAVSQPAIAQDDSGASIDEQHSGLADIVVTAQRRAENLQNVPIAITAADGDALAAARVENIANVQSVSPSISFRVSNISTSSANVIIRGLGTTGNSRSFEGSVGIFIDGVYRSRAAAALQNFLDIDNLQVLRGPQGTLFGKNTTAGALLLSSASPTLGSASGMIDLGYSNYNNLVARAAASVPLGDTAAIRIAGLASNNDGFYRDSTTGQRLNGDRTQAVKGQLLWEPGDSVSIRLIGDYSRGSGNCCYATTDFIDGPTQPLVDALATALGQTLPSKDLGDFEQTLNGNGRQVIEDYGGTLLGEFGLGDGTLKSVTALRRFSVDQRDMDPDFSGADIFRIDEAFKSRFFSQELTYNAKIDALNADLVLGAFYSNEKLRMSRGLPWASQGQAYWDTVLAAAEIPPGTVDASPGLWATEAMTGTAKSYAAFAHVDFAVGDRFNVLAGLRYSVERKTGSFRNPFYRSQPNDVFRVLGAMPGPAYADSTTDKSLSGTFGVQFRPVDEVMLYATYNRGFKAGGVNIDPNGAGTTANNPSETPGAVLLSPVYKPETVNAFEVGAKLQYLDRRARTNIAFFYYDLSDLQVAQFVGLRFTVLNAQSAKDYGVEVENLFQITDGLTLGLDGTWVPRARYGVDANIDPVLSGSRFRFAPKFQGNATLSLDQPISDTVNLTGRVQYQYSGRQFLNTASLAERGSVGLLNANLGFRLPDSNLSVEVWGQNLTNEVYPTLSFNTPLQTGDENAYLGAPRTYGVRLRATF